MGPTLQAQRTAGTPTRTRARLSTLQAILALVLALLTGYLATVSALLALGRFGLPSGGELLAFQALSSVGGFVLWRRVLLRMS